MAPLSLTQYNAIYITPILFICFAVLCALIYRRRRRRQRERKAGISRELNWETGAYELRTLPRARVRDGRVGVVRRQEEVEGVDAPPSYGEALVGERLPGYPGVGGGCQAPLGWEERRMDAAGEGGRRDGEGV